MPGCAAIATASPPVRRLPLRTGRAAVAATLLLTGFLLGMRHSLEADHVAAVASLVTRSRGLGWLHQGLQGLVGLSCLALGGWVALHG